jgi:hypothetical protein
MLGYDMSVTEGPVAIVILPSCFGGKTVAVPFGGIPEGSDESLELSEDGGMVTPHTAFLQEFFHISTAQRIPRIPPV